MCIILTLFSFFFFLTFVFSLTNLEINQVSAQIEVKYRLTSFHMDLRIFLCIYDSCSLKVILNTKLHESFDKVYFRSHSPFNYTVDYIHCLVIHGVFYCVRHLMKPCLLLLHFIFASENFYLSWLLIWFFLILFFLFLYIKAWLFFFVVDFLTNNLPLSLYCRWKTEKGKIGAGC